MNIAVISDIHGNHTALEACLDYLSDRKIDIYCFLGDYCGEFPGVEQTMKTLYDLRNEYSCFFLRGNKENYQLDGLGKDRPEWDDYPSTVGMLRYAYRHLGKNDIAFFDSLPISMTVKNEGLPDIEICHGSPVNVNEKFTEHEDSLERVVRETEAGYIICGHTHLVFNGKHGGKHIWNPGSAGASFDLPYSYRFMVLHDRNGGWEPEFISLEADVKRLVREMREAGLYETAPYWTRFTELLVTGECGKYTHGHLLNRAMEICRDRYGECIWPKVNEECFAEAFRSLFPAYKAG
ncbi:MAG: metallophosphatase family protein [Lachnospiraceae bacterium]|nr:metallophosphatase family protein [Lachnospiraceae bacterium]